MDKIGNSPIVKGFAHWLNLTFPLRIVRKYQEV